MAQKECESYNGMYGCELQHNHDGLHKAFVTNLNEPRPFPEITWTDSESVPLPGLNVGPAYIP